MDAPTDFSTILVQGLSRARPKISFQDECLPCVENCFAVHLSWSVRHELLSDCFMRMFGDSFLTAQASQMQMRRAIRSPDWSTSRIAVWWTPCEPWV